MWLYYKHSIYSHRGGGKFWTLHSRHLMNFFRDPQNRCLAGPMRPPFLGDGACLRAVTLTSDLSRVLPRNRSIDRGSLKLIDTSLLVEWHLASEKSFFKIASMSPVVHSSKYLDQTQNGVVVHPPLLKLPWPESLDSSLSACCTYFRVRSTMSGLSFIKEVRDASSTSSAVAALSNS